MNYRVIYSDDGTLSDFSVALNNYHAGTGTIAAFNASEDYIYIGSRWPFNSFYMAVSTANTASTTLSIDYWDGNQWQSAVDVIDRTNGLQQDGLITFVPDDSESGWVREDTVRRDGSEQVTGLQGVTIYDHFWLRLSYSNDLDPNTALKWLKYNFITDDDLYAEYRVFNNTSLLTRWQSGKTTWEEQIVTASNLVVDELVKNGVITSGNQLLDWSKMEAVAIPKTAEVIFNGLGDDYDDDRIKARNEFKSRSANKVFHVDFNGDARLNNFELNLRPGHFWR